VDNLQKIKIWARHGGIFWLSQLNGGGDYDDGSMTAQAKIIIELN
jgi:hypothetical protein